jgi:hypothetical protein
MGSHGSSLQNNIQSSISTPRIHIDAQRCDACSRHDLLGNESQDASLGLYPIFWRRRGKCDPEAVDTLTSDLELYSPEYPFAARADTLGYGPPIEYGLVEFLNGGML